MRIPALVIIAAAAAAPLSGQVSILRGSPGQFEPLMTRALADAPRAVIGLTTTGSATNRDTLGVLVSSVRPGSPADKAGIEEGNRIASVNGVSLKLSAPDVGAYEMADAMTRRLTRELNKLKPGDEVDLRVYASGQVKAIKVKTVAPDDLYGSTVAATSRRSSERATLGIGMAITGSSRDTLGVFVMSVADGGPAAKAGIEEGARIASINGVDVRGKGAVDDDDVVLRTTNISRLERELAKVKPGDDVDLRIYYNGQFRNVKVKTVRLSDLPPRRGSMTIMSGDNLIMPAMPPMPVMPAMPRVPQELNIDGPASNSRIQRAMDEARVFSNFPRLGNRLSW